MARPSLFDPGVHDQLVARLGQLSRNDKPRWGRMDPGRMLAHLRDAGRMTLGELSITAPLPFRPPRFLAALMIRHLPWPRSAKTAPELLPHAAASFEQDRQDVLEVLGRIVERHERGQALPPHPVFGDLGDDLHGRLLARHVDHHLRQFGR